MIDAMERVRTAPVGDVLVDHEIRLQAVESVLRWSKAAAVGAWATPTTLLGVILWHLVTNGGHL